MRGDDFRFPVFIAHGGPARPPGSTDTGPRALTPAPDAPQRGADRPPSRPWNWGAPAAVTRATTASPRQPTRPRKPDLREGAPGPCGGSEGLSFGGSDWALGERARDRRPRGAARGRGSRRKAAAPPGVNGLSRGGRARPPLPSARTRPATAGPGAEARPAAPPPVHPPGPARPSSPRPRRSPLAARLPPGAQVLAGAA